MNIFFAAVKQSALSFTSTDPVYVVLHALADATSSQNAEELVGTTGLDEKNVTVALSSLVTKGIIYEEQDEHYNLSRYGRGIVSHIQSSAQGDYNYVVPTQRAYTQVLSVLATHPELTSDEVTGIIKTPTAKAALKDLVTRGFITFDATRNSYALSPLGEAHTVRAKEQQELAKNVEPALKKDQIPPAQLALMKKMYEYFREQHPEYSFVYDVLDKSEDNMLTFFNDVRKWMRGGKIESPAFNRVDQVSKYWGGDTVPAQTSLEAAFSHEIRYTAMNIDKLKAVFPAMADVKLGRNYITILTQKATPEKITGVLRQYAPGTVLSKSQVMDIGSKIIGKSFPTVLNSTTATELIEQTLASKRNIQNGIFFPSDSPQAIAAELVRRLKGGDVAAFNRYSETTLSASSPELVFGANADYRNAKLAGITFVKTKLEGVQFENADLTGAKFNDITVTGCHFENANLTGADFTGATVTGNFFDGTDFTNVLGFDDEDTAFDLSKNMGTPKNLSLRRLQYAKDVVPSILELSPITTQAGVSLTNKNDDTSARAIIRILKNYLESLGAVSSLRFSATPPIVVTDDQIEALNQWIADKNSVPDFMTAESQNPMAWMVDARNSNAFVGKLSPADMKVLFTRIRDLKGIVRAPNVQKAPTAPKEQIESFTVDDLVGRYNQLHEQGEPFSIEDLLAATVTNKTGDLYRFLSSKVNDTWTQKKVHNLLNDVLSSVNKYSYNPVVPPKVGYSVLPVTATISNLKNTANPQGSGCQGKQFGIALAPNLGHVPDAVRPLIVNGMKPGWCSPHHAGSIAHCRVAPLHIQTTTGAGGVQQKYVWLITEIQSDVYQKAGKCGEQGLFTGDEVPRLRNYLKDWAENTLNIAIEYATQADVDEVWVPEHTAPEARWGTDADFSRAYDVPAKVFGGVLTNVPVTVPQDPGWSDSEKVKQVYVIDLKKKKEDMPPAQPSHVRTSMNAFGMLRFSALTEEDCNAFISYGTTLISKYREVPSFRQYNRFVTDEQIAQAAYSKSFENLSIDRTTENEEQLKQFIQSTVGYTIQTPQIDYFQWMVHADAYFKAFISSQNQITPGIASDEELARDAYKFWLEEVPEYIKNSSELLITIRSMLSSKGYGDVVGTDYLAPIPLEEREQEIINPTDTGGGELVGGPPGEEEEGGEGHDPSTEDKALQEQQKEQQNTIRFSPPGEREQRNMVQEEIDRLLDKLQTAQSAEEKAKIQRQLHELSTLASLKFNSLMALAFPSSNGLRIEPVMHEDRQRVLSLRSNVFSVVSSNAPPDSYYASIVDWSLCRKVATADGQIVGAYLIGRRQMPEVLATIPNLVVHENLSTYSGRRGVEGVSVFIEQPFRGVIGSQLLDVPYHVADADYIWGFAHKLLGNVDNWKRRRRVIAENDQLYVTVVDLVSDPRYVSASAVIPTNEHAYRELRILFDTPNEQSHLTFAAVDQEFNRLKNERQETPRNDPWQYEPAHGEGAPVGGGSDGDGGALDTSNMDMRGGFYTDLTLPDPHKKEKELVSFEPSNHVNLQPSFLASFDFVRFKTAVMSGMRGLNEFRTLTDEQLTAKLQDEWQWAKRAGIV